MKSGLAAILSAGVFSLIPALLQVDQCLLPTSLLAAIARASRAAARDAEDVHSASWTGHKSMGLSLSPDIHIDGLKRASEHSSWLLWPFIAYRVRAG